MHPFYYKSIYATSTVKYRFNTDFKFHYCLSAFCVLKSAWHLCSNNYIAVLYKWLFIVRTLQFSIYYCITCTKFKPRSYVCHRQIRPEVPADRFLHIVSHRRYSWPEMSKSKTLWFIHAKRTFAYRNYIR